MRILKRQYLLVSRIVSSSSVSMVKGRGAAVPELQLLRACAALTVTPARHCSAIYNSTRFLFLLLFTANLDRLIKLIEQSRTLLQTVRRSGNIMVFLFVKLVPSLRSCVCAPLTDWTGSVVLTFCFRGGRSVISLAPR